MNIAYRLLAALLAAIALTVGGYFFGRHVRDGELAQKLFDDAQINASLIRDAQDKADQLSADLSTARTATGQNNRVITREITRYVQVTPADQRVLLPDTWRLRHNLAATGAAADPGAGPVADGAAGPVEDAEALAVIDENYATCRDSAAKLAGWRQRWESIEQQMKAAQ